MSESAGTEMSTLPSLVVDGSLGVAYLQVRTAVAVARTTQVGNLLFDLDNSGALVGVEFLDVTITAMRPRRKRVSDGLWDEDESYEEIARIFDSLPKQYTKQPDDGDV